jgi:hypothetical protein
MLVGEFYPPPPGSFNRQGEPGQSLPTVPSIPFPPTSDNNNAGKKYFHQRILNAIASSCHVNFEFVLIAIFNSTLFIQRNRSP